MSRTGIVLALFIGIAPSVQAGPLHDAAGKGDLATVETLLAEGAKIDERGTDGDRPCELGALLGCRLPANDLRQDGGRDALECLHDRSIIAQSR